MRNESSFLQAHARNAVNLPFAMLFQLRQELPVPGTAILLVADDIETSSQLLQSWNYPVLGAIVWNKTLEQELAQSQCIEHGPASNFLWRPNDLLARFLEDELSKFETTRPLRALDIACGSGRDSVYLAHKGLQVSAFDWNEDALTRGRLLAERMQVSVNWQLADLESDTFAFDAQSFDLIHVARYLHRPMLPRLKSVLKPNGLLFYETFAVGAEKFGSPRNPKYLLNPGELAQVFDGMTTVFDAIECLSDGRPVQRFIARQALS